MTHDELVNRAFKWLRNKGCKPIFAETYCLSREQPDAIGWINSSHFSILIECKVSMDDFYADKRKPFRSIPEMGMGHRRYYLCPKGIIQKEKVPDGWGLLWIHGKQIRMQKESGQFTERNHNAEMNLILYKIRQMEWRKIEKKRLWRQK